MTLEEIRNTLLRIEQQRTYTIFHHPTQEVPELDFSLSGVLKFEPNKYVPPGVLWFMTDDKGLEVVTFAS